MKHSLTAVLFCLATPCSGAVERIVETFDGTGEFDSAEAVVSGLDNPGWFISGNGKLENGGYSFMNFPGIEEREDDQAERIIMGRGSFVSRMEIRDLDLGEIGEDSHSASRTSLHHILGEFRKGESLLMALQETPNSDSSHWVLGMGTDVDLVVETVPRGNHLTMQITFDDLRSIAEFSYDNDVNDAHPAMTFELEYSGAFRDSHVMSISFDAIDRIKNSGILDSYSLVPVLDVQGDFNGNDVLDAADIDLLSAEVRAGTNDEFFDLNDDLLVNDLDRNIWVHGLNNTFLGDANLNGEFNSADLVNVFGSAEYEDELPLNSTWATGDWNGDGDFTSSDLVFAFQDGGYEVGPRAAVVPEPSCLLLLALGLLAFGRCRQAIARWPSAAAVS